MSMKSKEKGLSQIEAQKGVIKEDGGGGKGKGREEEQEEEYCTTPTGSGNRIPEIQNCPPAPRKRRRPLASSSSSLLMRRSFTAHELHFFEDMRLEEVDSFFQSISMNEFSKLGKRCRSI